MSALNGTRSKKKREQEEKRQRAAEQQQKTQEFLASWSAENKRKRWMFKQWETLFENALHDAQQTCADDPSEENWAWVRALKDELRERGFYVPPPQLSKVSETPQQPIIRDEDDDVPPF